MRKDGMLRIAGGDDAREAIRGTTALVDGARLAYTLWKLDDDAARSVCNTLQIPFERGRIVRGAVVKANDEADHDAHTYTREDSGLLVQLETEPDGGAGNERESTFTLSQAREVLKEIQRRFDDGNPFSHAANNARYLGHYLTRQYGLSRKAAAELIADWIDNGVVGIDVVDRKSKADGAEGAVMAVKSRGGSGGRKSLIFLGGSAAEVGGSAYCKSLIFLGGSWRRCVPPYPHTSTRVRVREGRAHARWLRVAP